LGVVQIHFPPYAGLSEYIHPILLSISICVYIYFAIYLQHLHHPQLEERKAIGTMASNPDSVVEELGPLERLVQQRMEVKAAREVEDRDRATKQKTDDEMLEKAQADTFSALKTKQSAHLEQKRSDLDAALARIRDRHAKELDDLQRQHAQEITTQEGGSEQLLAEISARHDVETNSLTWQSEDEIRSRSAARAKEEALLKQQRKREDNLLKNKLLAAVDEEASRHARHTSTYPTAGQIVSNKRSIPVETNPDQKFSQSSKRKKLDESPHPKENSPSASASTISAPFSPLQASADAKPPSGVMCKVEEGSQIAGGMSALKTSFAIKFIKNNARSHPEHTWRASSSQTLKVLHTNTGGRTFEVYDGDRCETARYPGWVIDNTGSHLKELWSHRKRARIIFFAKQEYVRVQFTNIEEFAAFMLIFSTSNEGNLCRISPMVILSPFFFPQNRNRRLILYAAGS
jgi:hypothetical protein